jgi:hypothetical protein
LYNINNVELNMNNHIKIIDEFPLECALVKRFRRIADDPRSYAWDARKYAIINIL